MSAWGNPMTNSKLARTGISSDACDVDSTTRPHLSCVKRPRVSATRAGGCDPRSLKRLDPSGRKTSVSPSSSVRPVRRRAKPISLS
jgi:hypothetical protein